MKKLLFSVLAISLLTSLLTGQYTLIPDANFEQRLINLGIDSEGDPVDGRILTADAEAVTDLRVHSASISDLTGIEAFINLDSLNCHDNDLTALDLSANVSLVRVFCSANNLTALDVTANTALVRLSALGNDLTSIDVSGLTSLTHLNVYHNELAAIDVSTNTALISLSMGTNNLTGVDVSNNTALKYLIAFDNEINSIDVSNNPDLVTLSLGGNNLTELDVSNNTALEALSFFLNNLTTIDLTNNTALINLKCDDNNLSSLDIRNSHNTLIEYFQTTGNADLTCIDVDDAAYSTANWTDIDPWTTFSESCMDLYTLIPDPNFEQKLIDLGIDSEGGPIDGRILTADAEAVTELNVHNSSIADLTGIEAFINITTLYCHTNDLTMLDVSSNAALTHLYCGDNNLTTIDVTANAALVRLSALANDLTSVDVTGLANLTHLNVYHNNLSTIDVTTNTALISLSMGTNNLTEIDVSNNTALQALIAFDNDINSIDVSNNPDLLTLSLGGNNLSSLDVSNNTALEVLSFFLNNLTTIDLSNNIALTSVKCNDNNLTSLDIRNGHNTLIEYFETTGNEDLICIDVDDAAYSTANWTDIDPWTSFSEDCICTTGPDIDGDGISDVCDDILNFRGAADALIADIRELDIPGGRSMIKKIRQALRKCQRGQSRAAINQLRAFIRQVQWKRGRHLTDEQADDFIGRARAIIRAIRDGSIDCSTPLLSFSSPDVEGVTIYPNPSNGQFTVSLNYPDSRLIACRIINMQGSIIWEERFNRGDTFGQWTKDFDLPGNQIYFFVTITEDEVEVMKVAAFGH